MSESQENEKNPFDNRVNVKVAGVSDVEMNDSVYDSAKMQNRMRWGIVMVVVVIMAFFAYVLLGPLIGMAAGIGVSVLVYLALSKLLPLANLTSTVKYKKFGDNQKMDRMKAKLGIGQDVDE